MVAQFVTRSLPPELEGLADLALDLRWTRNHATDQLWTSLDADAWERTGNPYFVLQSVSQSRCSPRTSPWSSHFTGIPG